MALSGIELSAGVIIGRAKPIDAKYGPYPDVATAKADIGASLRYLGLTVGIETGGVVEEYWWESGTADADLVAKGGGGAAWGGITGTLSDQTDLQSALDAKEPTITATTSADYYRGDKTFATLDKTAVGLSNVDNTSDLNKPISTATQTALDAKQATITGAATTIDTEDLTASRALVSDASGKVAVSDVTATELGYLDGVTSAVQTQINSKISTYDGVTYDVTALAAVSQAEYDAIGTKSATTLYFII